MAKKTKKKGGKKVVRKAAKKAGKPRVRKKASGRGHATAAVKYVKRADLGSGADGYFAKIGGGLKEVGGRLREIVRGAAPQASETIKWGMPVYEHRGMLCYIRARPAYVTLGFYQQGVHLADPDGLLEGTGDNMRHVKVRKAEHVRAELFSGWVKRAVEINDQG